MPTGQASVSRRMPITSGSFTPSTYNAMVVVDKQSLPLTSVEGDPTAGEAFVQLGPPQSGQGYLVERIDLWSNSTGAPVASVYVGAPAPQNEMDFSTSAGHDISDERNPIYVPPGSPLVILWSGLSAGAAVTARVQYSVVQFVSANFPSAG